MRSTASAVEPPRMVPLAGLAQQVPARQGKLRPQQLLGYVPPAAGTWTCPAKALTVYAAPAAIAG
jgi:hypothetical protein